MSQKVVPEPVDKPRSPRSEAAARANALVRAAVDLLQLKRMMPVRFNNQPIAQKVRGVLVGYRSLNNRRGIPDVWAICPGGRILLVECKHGVGRVSRDQEAFLDDCERSGALCLVIGDVRQLEGFILVGTRVGWSAVQSDWRKSDNERRVTPWK